ncbi:MAG: AMP-binding protein [Deltaproteobacteria bacterium]|nr:AMP-binding protein [Deltaproteobacteria bacterium]MBW2359429.1 AMP-binding protein [Deltaproteobacteria bacterium]
MIFEKARSQAGALALDDGTRQRSWAELEERVHRLTHLLHDELGVRPHEHAAYLIGNRVEAVELILASLVSGTWMTPINHRLQPDEIAHVVRDSGAKVVFVDAEHGELARAAGAPELHPVGEALDAALANVSAAPLPFDGPAGGNMIYTSGTSGRPKGVKRRRPSTVEAALAGVRAYGKTAALDGSGPHLVTGPVYHAAPLMFAIYDLMNGAPILIHERFDERHTLATLREREVHHTHLVPTMFVRLLRLGENERHGFAAPSLHLVLHGAAPVAPAVKRRMIDWWGPILVEYWGGTEGGVNTLVDSEEWLSHPGTVGRVLPQFEVFSVNDAGERLAPGEEGLLYCRNKTLDRCFEYHGDEEKTAAAFLDDATFTLGDIGRVDAENFTYLSDRKSNLIISGGVNIYPAEIEAALQEHPAIADIGVFGIPDDEWGESVKAAVELRPGFEPSAALDAEIRAFAREHLASYKVPRSIDFEAELPRDPNGKLLVRRLRERYWRGRKRRI